MADQDPTDDTQPDFGLDLTPKEVDAVPRDVARRRAKAEAAEAKLARKAARQSRGPSVWKTYVVPALTIICIAAIGAALVKLAFFPDEAPQAAPIQPGFETSDPTVAVTLGTVVNEVSAEGSVVQDDAAKVRATAAGTVWELLTHEGAWLNAGDPMYSIRSETTDEPSEDDPTPEPVVRWYTIDAPATGAVTSLPALVGQVLQIGDDVGTVQPYTYHIEAPMTAEEQYRLLTLPAEAQVTLRGGPAPFTCTGLTIQQPTPSGGSQDGSNGGTVSQATARCTIPADVRVFPGLTADVTIAAGSAENVLTLPVTALVGTAVTGVVYLPGVDGADPTPVDVTLGMNDGTIVEITGGIEEGTEVLQFAPGQSAAVDPCAPDTFDPNLCTGTVGGDGGVVIMP